MKKTFSFASLVLAGMVLLVGCQKDGTRSGNDKMIRFTAGLNPPATRTAYSGEVTGGFERIDWVNGDLIRIWSDKAKDRYNNNPWADYSIKSVTPDGNKSVGTLANTDDGNGLVWEEAGGNYTFYSVYPSDGATIVPDDPITGGAASGMSIAAAQSASGTPGTGTGSFKIDGTVTTVNTVVLHPDMSNALMFAANVINYNAVTVNLDFYPAYTAFEISLVCGDSDADIALSSFTLSSTSKALSGPFTALVKRYNDTAYTCPAYSTSNNSITFDLTGQVISKTKGLTFTVFALPQDLTDLKIRFDLADATFRALDLKQSGSFINFPAGKKHRITGIAMPSSAWRFSIDLGGQSLPWDLNETTATFTSQVASDPFVTSNAVEAPGTNNYEEAYGNYRYYNIRTLDTGSGKTYFEVTFTPKAPLGGYWWLQEVATGVGDTNDMFKVEVWDDEAGQGSETLRGQIMNQEVTIHISLDPLVPRDTEHSLILKAFFSPTPDPDDQISADSEVQDVHKDGTFSYWKFVFPIQ